MCNVRRREPLVLPSGSLWVLVFVVRCWVGLGWVGSGRVGSGRVGSGRAVLGWVGLGWVGLGWVGLGWVGLGSVRSVVCWFVVGCVFGCVPCTKST